MSLARNSERKSTNGNILLLRLQKIFLVIKTKSGIKTKLVVRTKWSKQKQRWILQSDNYSQEEQEAGDNSWKVSVLEEM